MNKITAKLLSRPVYVEWFDSEMTHGWKGPDEAADHDLLCWTIGFLVKETDDWITVCTSVSAHGHVCDQMTIPWVAITKFQDIHWS